MSSLLSGSPSAAAADAPAPRSSRPSTRRARSNAARPRATERLLARRSRRSGTGSSIAIVWPAASRGAERAIRGRIRRQARRSNPDGDHRHEVAARLGRNRPAAARCDRRPACRARASTSRVLSRSRSRSLFSSRAKRHERAPVVVAIAVVERGRAPPGSRATATARPAPRSASPAAPRSWLSVIGVREHADEPEHRRGRCTASTTTTAATTSALLDDHLDVHQAVAHDRRRERQRDAARAARRCIRRTPAAGPTR